MDNSFSINGVSFKLNKLSAFKQFHIVRRLAPILGEMLPVLQKLQGLNKAESQSDQLALLEPIMKGLGGLSDADSDKVLLGLLSCVEMQQSTGNWAFLVRNDQLMFGDLDLPVMLQAAGRAFAYNMAGFFSGLQPASPVAG